MNKENSLEITRSKVHLPEIPSLQSVIKNFEFCSDITHQRYPEIDCDILYFEHMVSEEKLEREVVLPLTGVNPEEINGLFRRKSFEQINDLELVIEEILSGKTAIFFNEHTWVVNVSGPEMRSVERSETETVINGPHDSFIENAVTNISLIRNRLKTSHLKAVRMQVGRLTKTDVYLLYVDELVDLEIKKELENRISNLEIAGIQDTNMLVQLIDDSPNSIFPQFQTGERPDTAVSKLLEGKVVGLVDGSPNMFSAPTGFFDFFHSPDDYYQRWVIASSIRIIRFFALFITLFFTPLYVAVATYHYDMIPEDLLISMATSRMEVPFPPIYEALFMEFTLELLREAGARLPTKVGQTIGIVGGIVIGQAAVDAGITSNILIIVVAVSALASFVIPNYIMSTSLRLARFVLILLAGILGNFGMMIGIGLIVIHLSGLSNLKKPYMAPISPYKKTAWIDTVIRGPYKEHMISKELSNKKST